MTKRTGHRWQQVRDAVLTRIRAREWQPGALIPNEEDLAREFGCARATVNRALQHLADDGTLERKRKAGTRVALTPVRHARLSIPIIRNEIEASGAAYSYALINRDVLAFPTHLRLRLGLNESASGLHVQALHLADGVPYLFEHRWINPVAIPEVLDAPFAEISPNEWLLRNASYTEGEIAFTAEMADARDAEVLNVPVGAALFVLERITRSGGQPVTWVRMAYAPGHRMVSVI